MSIQGEEASSCLVGPHFDLVVITTCCSFYQPPDPTQIGLLSKGIATGERAASDHMSRTGNEQGLVRVESDTSDRTIVFFESVNQGSHAVIP